MEGRDRIGRSAVRPAGEGGGCTCSLCPFFFFFPPTCGLLPLALHQGVVQTCLSMRLPLQVAALRQLSKEDLLEFYGRFLCVLRGQQPLLARRRFAFLMEGQGGRQQPPPPEALAQEAAAAAAGQDAAAAAAAPVAGQPAANGLAEHTTCKSRDRSLPRCHPFSLHAARNNPQAAWRRRRRTRVGPKMRARRSGTAPGWRWCRMFPTCWHSASASSSVPPSCKAVFDQAIDIGEDPEHTKPGFE